MRIFSTFRIAVKNILKNKTRSFLTSLGIIIGICSVVIMVGIGEGAQQSIKEEILSMGTNLIMIRPGSNQGGSVKMGGRALQSLTLEDVYAIKKESIFVKYISPFVSSSQQIIGNGNNWNTSINGVSEDYLDIKNYTTSAGYFFNNDEVTSKKNYAVLGTTVVEQLFPNSDPLGQRIRIGSQPFNIIGVLSEIGESSNGMDQDDIIIIPYTTALNKIIGNKGGKKVRDIFISCINGDEIEKATEEVETIMRKSHKISDPINDDFVVGTQSDIIERATTITSFLTLLLGAIAGVSLLVGGIGIMNIMLVSVTERTREIGIRIAVGAKSRDILLQFLIESVVLSLIGGLLAIIISLITAFVLNQFTDYTMVINGIMIVISFVFSGVIGISFGFFPAKKAANLNPIDALRYE